MQELVVQGKAIEVAIRRNPLNFELEYATAYPEEKISDIVARHGFYYGPVKTQTHVYIGGDYIPECFWNAVRLRENAPIVSINIVPHGGGGGKKNTVGTLLSIAALFVAPEVGGFLAGQLGIASSSFFGITAGKILGGVFSIVSTMVINALAPPPQQQSSATSPAENPTLYIAGASNQVMRFSRVPRVLGKMRMNPPYGALPFTEAAGSDQYLRLIFCLGYGPLDISELKIADTDLSNYTDVQYEIRQGYPDDTPLTLYTNSPRENALSINLTFALGSQIQTTDPETDQISIDISFPRGLCQFGSSGSTSPATVQITVEYSPAGANTWTTVPGGFNVTASQTSAMRQNLIWDVPNGQYDVRLTRTTADATTTQVFDESDWTALRSIQSIYPIELTGMALIAMRIKATDQLNGTVDQFNCMVQSIVPDWNGSAWVAAPTSNPASLYRSVLQDKANARPLPDSRINLDDLQDWWQNNDDNDREYNAIIDQDMSAQDVLAQVAACGRASPGRRDSKYTIIQDVAQTVPRQHITPRNSYNFQWQLSYPVLPHAFRVQYVNRDTGYQADERLVFDDGYSEFGEVPGTVAATIFVTLPLPGVTSSDQAWKDGRYHIATLRLRPTTYVFYTDMDHISCKRGQLIKFNHDVILAGLGYARVTEVIMSGDNTVAISVDDIFTMLTGTSYAVRVRRQTGDSSYQPISTVPGETQTLYFTAPFATIDGDGNQVVNPGDLVMFGEAGQESLDVIVKSIEPAAGLQAKITCVDAAPGVFVAETGTIPPYNSGVTLPPELLQPPMPVVSTVQADDSVMIISATGAYQPAIVINLAPPPYSVQLTPGIQIQAASETSFHPAKFTWNGNQIVITDVDSGVFYNIAIVYKNANGVSSGATLISGQQVTAGTTAPPDVKNFSVNILSGTAYLTWLAVPSVTLSSYQIKYSTATSGANWANSLPLVDTIPASQTSIAVPALPGTYLIKAVNQNGNKSADETLIVSTIGGLTGLTSVLLLEEDPAFGGPQTNCTISGGSLVLADTSVDGAGVGNGSGIYNFDLSNYMDDWLDVDLISNWDTYVEETGDLGAVYNVTVTADLTVIGVDGTSGIDNWDNIDNVDDWDQSEPPSTWGVELQIRTTSDNPTVSPTWRDWKRLVVGEYTARAVQFRLILNSYAAGITPAVSALAVTLNMPNRTESANDVTANAGDADGTAFTFNNAFRATPSLNITGQSMSTGDYWEISEKTADGFKIKFFNNSDTRITKTFDYQVSGYGQGA